ncbi:hypothetical protein L1987_25517 [Smallanthus sonchifolius]|uniref:Uncharacterized protein n=1 Tax=Smallanthus sonchifolius TaxID=185202 RepID=A0ACB9IQE3_9ASTR|nr:hypothetical protein L1987_25517 [Smallanthus sonchifolius]
MKAPKFPSLYSQNQTSTLTTTTRRPSPPNTLPIKATPPTTLLTSSGLLSDSEKTEADAKEGELDDDKIYFLDRSLATPRHAIDLLKRDTMSKQKVEKFDTIDLNWTDKMSECPVYFPSKEEYEDP